MGLILSAMIGSIDVVPVLGEDGHKGMEEHDDGRSEHRGRGYDHDRYLHDGRYYQPYGYYTPPPVIYVPPPKPGVRSTIPRGSTTTLTTTGRP